MRPLSATVTAYRHLLAEGVDELDLAHGPFGGQLGHRRGSFPPRAGARPSPAIPALR